MKQELMRIHCIGWVFKRTGSIGVDRSAGMAALKKLKRDALIALETGRPLLIFPQGTRVLPRTEAPYQIGVYALYSATGLPVVPVALNSGSFWPRKGSGNIRAASRWNFCQKLRRACRAPPLWPH